MDERHRRITVVGTRRRVDLTVPSQAPIADYITPLTRMCGEETDETFPAAWSLAPADAPALNLATSLRDAKITDGTTLYLRDTAANETDGPLATDVLEVIEHAGPGARWNARHRALTVLGIGLGGLTAAVATLALTSPASPFSLPTAILSGIALAASAALATRRGWPVPAPARLAMALALCPIFALAGYTLPAAHNDPKTAAIAVASGAALGALTALLAIPGTYTLIALLFTMASLPVTLVFAAAKANPTRCAAVVAVAALAILHAAPRLAGSLTAERPLQTNASPFTYTGGTSPSDRGRRALVTVTITCSLILAGCLIVLADSDDAYPNVLALWLSAALLLRAPYNIIPTAVIPVLGAGATGVTTLLIRYPTHADAPPATGPLLALGTATIIIAVGLATPQARTRILNTDPSWTSPLGIALSLITIPLALGVFGVFQ